MSVARAREKVTRGLTGEVGDAQDGVKAQKSYRKILAQEIATGVEELERSTSGLLLSGLSAGLDVGFSLFLMGVMMTLAGPTLPRPVVEILVACMYSVGFIFVILGRSELFTEHTTLAVLPVLGGRATVPQLLRLWGLIYVSNLAGATVFAAIAAWVGPALGVIEPWALGKIAHGLVDHPAPVVLASGVLAGWMMGLLSWLVTAARDTVSQLLFVWLITFAIGLSHLHHAIAGTVEVLAGLFSGQGITATAFALFLLLSTAGNILGGVIFVAILKFAHATQAGAE
jgi:formate-nitrite transporter family protein